MNYTGNLVKMRATLHQDSVQYELHLNGTPIAMNDLIGKDIRLTFSSHIHCKVCGRKTKKSFAQGFCYPCFKNAPQNSPCIIRPELCEAHLGKGRDIEWEETHHLQKHIVYLAVTSGLKVGVTRHDQIPTRWIDQGAWKAIRLAETPHRNFAGQIEVALKTQVSDKTNWQRMLKNILATDINILKQKQHLKEFIPKYLQQFYSSNDEVIELNYPVLTYPKKVKSLSFDKMALIAGKLLGIKGQYLLFEGDTVLNIRKHTGYQITFSIQ